MLMALRQALCVLLMLAPYEPARSRNPQWHDTGN